MSEALTIAAARAPGPRVRVAALIGLALLLAGCARSHEVPVASQAAAPVTFAQPEAEAPPPAPAAQVEQAQRALAELGYEPGPADGVEGPRTQAAVRAFQESADQTADGRVTEALLAALEPALESHRVTQVQRRIAALGYDPGPVDGRLGRQTSMAVKRFEADAGAEPQGKITPELFDLLAKAEASQVQWVADEAALEQTLSPTAGPNSQGAETGETTPLSARIEVAAVQGPDDAPAETEPSKRLILPGDTVRLRIGTDQIEVKEFQVGLDGMLELPDDVSLQAAGLTAKQLEDLIMVKLVEVYLMGLKVDVMQPAATAEEGTGQGQAPESDADPDTAGKDAAEN